MRVLWTRAALASLAEITDHIAQHSPVAALRLVDEIPARVTTLLTDNPMIGRAGRVTGTRELVLSGTPYLVAYRVGDHVDVLAVLHGARAWPDDF